MAFEIKNGVLLKYIEEEGVTEVVIPEGVTSIGSKPQSAYEGSIIEQLLQWKYAPKAAVFTGCTNLTRVVIPDSVTNIEDKTFKDCTNLTSVVLPQGLKIIGFGMFDQCSSLTDITIPKSVTCIEGSAFKGCRSLTSITIPEGVTCIDYWTFEDCENLTEIVIPESVTRIDFSAFRGCRKLASVTIPASVTKFGGHVFDGTAWLEQHPDDLVIINHVLIAYKGKEASLTIPEGVTDIAEGAVKCCKELQHVTIPDSVTSIGKGTFNECAQLNSITLYHVTFRPWEMKSNDLYDAMEMLKNRDFSVELNQDIKFAAAIGFYLNTNDAAAETYLRANAFEVFRFLIDNGNVESIYRLLETASVLTAETIDPVIDYVIEKGSVELRVVFLHYKEKVLGYNDPGEMFRL